MNEINYSPKNRPTKIICTEFAQPIIIHEKINAGEPNKKIVLRAPSLASGINAKSEPAIAPKGTSPPDMILCSVQS